MSESTVVTPEQPPTTTAPQMIIVYVCPNCGSYASSSNLGALEQKPNHRSSMRNKWDEDPSEWGGSIGSRAVCQTCRQQGRGDFERVPLEYVRVQAVKEAIDIQLAKAHAEFNKQK